jgi:hypothetical protein
MPFTPNKAYDQRTLTVNIAGETDRLNNRARNGAHVSGFRNKQVIAALFLTLAVMAGLSAACSGQQAAERVVTNECTTEGWTASLLPVDAATGEKLLVVDVVVASGSTVLYRFESTDPPNLSSASGTPAITGSDLVQLGKGTHPFTVYFSKPGYRPAKFDLTITLSGRCSGGGDFGIPPGFKRYEMKRS